MPNTDSPDRYLWEDIKRLLITIAVTAVVIAAVVLLEQKTHFIIKLFSLGA